MVFVCLHRKATSFAMRPIASTEPPDPRTRTAADSRWEMLPTAITRDKINRTKSWKPKLLHENAVFILEKKNFLQKYILYKAILKLVQGHRYRYWNVNTSTIALVKRLVISLGTDCTWAAVLTHSFKSYHNNGIYIVVDVHASEFVFIHGWNKTIKTPENLQKCKNPEKVSESSAQSLIDNISAAITQEAQ